MVLLSDTLLEMPFIDMGFRHRLLVVIEHLCWLLSLRDESDSACSTFLPQIQRKVPIIPGSFEIEAIFYGSRHTSACFQVRHQQEQLVNRACPV